MINKEDKKYLTDGLVYLYSMINEYDFSQLDKYDYDRIIKSIDNAIYYIEDNCPKLKLR